jgi:hypothetical protein
MYRSRSIFRALPLVSFLLLSSIAGLAGKHFVMPVAQPAKTYPAHDEHPSEAVTLALDPYDMADKASIFSIHYNDVGLMPIFVVITNDGDQPVSLAGMKGQLVTSDRTKIPPATEDDLCRRLARPPGSISPNPLPWPKKSQFAARAVEPHGSQSGFMFFDVSGISSPLAGAHFYLTGVRDSKGNELMYFEVPLEKYLSAPVKPN